jgi:hypothetical protein
VQTVTIPFGAAQTSLNHGFALIPNPLFAQCLSF